LAVDPKTHGLYFGLPEPSYYLDITPKNYEETVSSLATFAKANYQDSFFTATKTEPRKGNLLAEFNFQKEITPEDIINIQKIANDNGLGLTLSRSGNAYAANIQEWDGYSPTQFMEAVNKTTENLNSAGYRLSSQIDSYDIKVYTKDTYDRYISNTRRTNRRTQQQVQVPREQSAGNVSRVQKETPTRQEPENRPVSKKETPIQSKEKIITYSGGNTSFSTPNLEFAKTFGKNVVKREINQADVLDTRIPEQRVKLAPFVQTCESNFDKT